MGLIQHRTFNFFPQCLVRLKQNCPLRRPKNDTSIKRISLIFNALFTYNYLPSVNENNTPHIQTAEINSMENMVENKFIQTTEKASIY